MNDSGLLAKVLEGFDVEAFGERVGRSMMAEARAEIPELGLVADDVLVQLLGAAGLRGMGELVDAAGLALAIGGPEDDPALQALRSTVEQVRTVLGLFHPEGEVSHEDRQAMALLGIDMLARIVTGWDRTELAQQLPPEEPPE